jgi:hypothetical protein
MARFATTSVELLDSILRFLIKTFEQWAEDALIQFHVKLGLYSIDKYTIIFTKHLLM